MKHTPVQGKNLKCILSSVAIFMIAFPIACIISTYIWRKGVITWDYAISWEARMQETKEIVASAERMMINVFVICTVIFAAIAIGGFCTRGRLKTSKATNLLLTVSTALLLFSLISYFSIEQMPGDNWYEESEEMLNNELVYDNDQLNKLLDLCGDYNERILTLNDKYNSSEMIENYSLSDRAVMFDNEVCQIIDDKGKEYQLLITSIRRCSERLNQCHGSLISEPQTDNARALHEKVYALDRIVDDINELIKKFTDFSAEHKSNDVAFYYPSAEELGIRDNDLYDFGYNLTNGTAFRIEYLRNRLNDFSSNYLNIEDEKL